MNRGLKITAAVVLVLALVLGGAYFWISRPVALETFNEPGAPAAVKEQNSLVETALFAVGVDSALVDITNERAYVAYDMPNGTLLSEDALQVIALKALASNSDVDQGIAVMYVDGVAKLMWKGSLNALRAAGDDEAKFDAFLASVEKTAF